MIIQHLFTKKKDIKYWSYFSTFIIILFTNIVHAAPIYKWEDSDGVVHYSSKPIESGSKPAELPEIMRGEFKVSKHKRTASKLTCEGHGGIDCQIGADADGSVICIDGYTESKSRFAFSCSSPLLKISEIGEMDKDGSCIIVVRNMNSVLAKKTSLWFKPTGGIESKLNGPKEIEPFGLAEFKIPPPKKDGPLIEKPKIDQLRLTCANCN